jgi:hypothetical protein
VERKRRSAKKRKKFKKSKRFISGSLELIQLHTSGSASASAAAAARKSNKLLSLRPWTLVRGAPGASVLYVCLQRKRDGRERGERKSENEEVTR